MLSPAIKAPYCLFRMTVPLWVAWSPQLGYLMVKADIDEYIGGYYRITYEDSVQTRLRLIEKVLLKKQAQS